MATDKPGLTVYVSTEIKAALDSYKNDRHIRSTSTAVEEILKEFFSLVETGEPSELVKRSELDELRQRLEAIEKGISIGDTLHSQIVTTRESGSDRAGIDTTDTLHNPINSSQDALEQAIVRTALRSSVRKKRSDLPIDGDSRDSGLEPHHGKALTLDAAYQLARSRGFDFPKGRLCHYVLTYANEIAQNYGVVRQECACGRNFYVDLWAG